MASNYTTLDNLFKQRYADGLEDLTYKDRPLLGLLPKRTDIGGASSVSTRAFAVPLKYANTAAVSGSFTQAQNRSANVSSQVVAFQIVTMHQYGFLNLDMESIERSEGNENAFVDIKGLETDAVIENLSNRLQHFAYLDGTGALALTGNATQMPSFATSTMVLNNPENAVYFMPGDELTLSATESGGELAFGTNAHGWYVIAVNLDAGTFQVGNLAGTAVNLNDAADGIPTGTNLQWIAHRGDRQVAGTIGGTVISGFQHYIPSLATGIAANDSCYNVNRSKMTDFLAGSRQDYSSYGIEEALVRGTNVVAKKGGKIEQYFVNHKHYSDLVSAISARGQVTYLDIRPSEYPTIGYRGVRIVGANADVDVISDYACPSTLAAGMRIDAWKMASVGEMIHIMSGDGLEFLRLAGSDGLQAYWVSYANMYPEVPRDNINITLAA